MLPIPKHSPHSCFDVDIVQALEMRLQRTLSILTGAQNSVHMPEARERSIMGSFLPPIDHGFSAQHSPAAYAVENEPAAINVGTELPKSRTAPGFGGSGVAPRLNLSPSTSPRNRATKAAVLVGSELQVQDGYYGRPPRGAAGGGGEEGSSCHMICFYCGHDTSVMGSWSPAEEHAMRFKIKEAMERGEYDSCECTEVFAHATQAQRRALHAQAEAQEEARAARARQLSLADQGSRVISINFDLMDKYDTPAESMWSWLPCCRSALSTPASHGAVVDQVTIEGGGAACPPGRGGASPSSANAAIWKARGGNHLGGV